MLEIGFDSEGVGENETVEEADEVKDSVSVTVGVVERGMLPEEDKLMAEVGETVRMMDPLTEGEKVLVTVLDTDSLLSIVLVAVPDVEDKAVRDAVTLLDAVSVLWHVPPPYPKTQLHSHSG